jgi:hypothetical protein
MSDAPRGREGGINNQSHDKSGVLAGWSQGDGIQWLLHLSLTSLDVFLLLR